MGRSAVMAELKKLGEKPKPKKSTKAKTSARTPKTGKMSIAQTREELAKAQEELAKIKDAAWCHLCGTLKDRLHFYVDSDPMSKTGVSPICKECANKIAFRVGSDGERQEPTKESVKLALRYLNKPYYEKVWDSSVQESQSLIIQKKLNNVWTSYIKNISMINYKGKTYADSDMFKSPSMAKLLAEKKKEYEETPEMKESFEQNKDDVLRLLGYDPFINENPDDLPFLYANTIGYLDTSGLANEDQLKMSSIIEIVKNFNHTNKINDMLAELMSDKVNIGANMATIKALESTKKDITSSTLGLAKDNAISLNYSKNASKGENTWTGMVKKLKEMDLREQEVNVYNAKYADGLRQVAEISDAAIIKQIALDENDYVGMIADARKMITDLTKKADKYEEIARQLLRENYDLKDLLKEHGIDIGNGGDD